MGKQANGHTLDVETTCCPRSLSRLCNSHRNSTSLSIYLSPTPLTDKGGDLTSLIEMGNSSSLATRLYLEYVRGKKKESQWFRTIMEKPPMKLAFLY